ncbi:MAG TPA: AbrB/MazE/SpoVT family DNA-binding domain-containing protein [Pseudolabrys sp.]|nr:AbrB/MazE/SpoVT family DNA-binding domain-containing protein [Pseudolabrys sp.]
MELDKAEMDRLTDGLPTKSAKMRALANAGYSRSDIARYLGARYQFVRNVLLRDQGRRPDTPARAFNPNATINRVQLGADGQVALPEVIRDALQLREGETLIATVEDDEIRLMTIPVAVRKAQALIRQYIPEGVSLVDELLEDRRREVERERDDE